MYIDGHSLTYVFTCMYMCAHARAQVRHVQAPARACLAAIFAADPSSRAQKITVSLTGNTSC